MFLHVERMTCLLRGRDPTLGEAAAPVAPPRGRGGEWRPLTAAVRREREEAWES